MFNYISDTEPFIKTPHPSKKYEDATFYDNGALHQYIYFHKNGNKKKINTYDKKGNLILTSTFDKDEVLIKQQKTKQNNNVGHPTNNKK